MYNYILSIFTAIRYSIVWIYHKLFTIPLPMDIWKDSNFLTITITTVVILICVSLYICKSFSSSEFLYEFGCLNLQYNAIFQNLLDQLRETYHHWSTFPSTLVLLDFLNVANLENMIGSKFAFLLILLIIIYY